MYTEAGINKKTQELFLKSLDYVDGDKEYLKKLGYLYLKLNSFTMKRDRLFLSKKDHKDFENITDDKEDFCHYKDDDFDFEFGLLSDRINDKRSIRKLKSNRRFHKCHEASVGISLHDDEGNLTVLTGYMPSINAEILHSVIEMKDKDTTYIIDYTQNLIMRKEDFIKVNQFRVLNKVNSKELKSDSELMTTLQISCPLYLVFRDEIMKDLKKNSKVLKLED